ncbi:MAG TPA: branched-chain amino acid ABC transporter permease, partial [Ktedonobacterales bacterium]
QATPLIRAIWASSAVLVLWALSNFLLAAIFQFHAEVAFKYTGIVLQMLLMQSLGSFYAGFLAADGDPATAVSRGRTAGIVAGVAGAVLWGAWNIIFSFVNPFQFDLGSLTIINKDTLDPVYGIGASVALLILLPLLGWVAGIQGARLWQTNGVGRPAPQRQPAPTGGGFRFQLSGTILWGFVGLVLLSFLFGQTKEGQYLLSVLSNLVVLVAVAIAIIVVIFGVRWLWPRITGIRTAVHAAWSVLVGNFGAGNRTRSTGSRLIIIAAALVLVLLYPYLDPYTLGSATDARISILSDTGYYVVLALGLNVVVGFAGLLDLGYVAFFVFGSYTWAVLGAPQFSVIAKAFHNLSGFPELSRNLPFNIPWAWWFWPALLIGALVAAFFGVLLGAPTLRLRGDYLAIVTLGFGEIVPILFRQTPRLTNGTNSVNGIPSAIVPGLTFPISDATPYFYIVLVVIALTIICNVRIRDSRFGRAFVALREDEIAVAATGVNTVRTKLLAFGTGAFFSGMAGVYHAARLGVINPSDFSFSDSITYLAMVVLGGIGSIPGVILGAGVIAFLNLYVLDLINRLSKDPNNALYALRDVQVSNLRFVIFGTLLVLMMLTRPEGLIPNARRRAELHGEVLEETESPAMDALDAAIGGPAYVEEPVE